MTLISRDDFDKGQRELLDEYEKLLLDTHCDEYERYRLKTIVAALFEMLNRRLYGPRKQGEATTLQLD